MAADESAEILNAINLHASVLLQLSKTHSTVYRAWLRSRDKNYRQEWTQLVGGSDGGKGRQRRKRVEALLNQEGQPSTKPVQQGNNTQVSPWKKREDLFVLCTKITLEELVGLNCLEEPASFFEVTDHLSSKYDFSEAYRRSLGRETRRIRDRILERFECLLFYLNLVLGGYHSGTGWLHKGHSRLLEIQKPPGDVLKAKKRNERMAEHGLSYYCWGIFLGDLRNLIRLRADEDVPESLYGDRHHRPRIPYYANQLFEAGLCGNASQIQKCVDSIVQTWPVIPKTVTLQVITSLMQGKHWDLLSSEAKKKTEERISTTMTPLSPDATIKSTASSSTAPPDQVDTLSAAALSSVQGESELAFQYLRQERLAADSLGVENDISLVPNVLDSEMTWLPIPDLMYGTMFTSFLEPSYGNAFSSDGWPDHGTSALSVNGMDF